MNIYKRYMLAVPFALMFLYSCESNSVDELNALNSSDVVNIQLDSTIPNANEIKIADRSSIKSVIEWLKGAYVPDRMGSYVIAEHSLILTMQDMNKLHIKISSPGLGYTTINYLGEQSITGEYPDIEELAKLKHHYEGMEGKLSPSVTKE